MRIMNSAELRERRTNAGVILRNSEENVEETRMELCWLWRSIISLHISNGSLGNRIHAEDPLGLEFRSTSIGTRKCHQRKRADQTDRGHS